MEKLKKTSAQGRGRGHLWGIHVIYKLKSDQFTDKNNLKRKERKKEVIIIIIIITIIIIISLRCDATADKGAQYLIL